MPQGAVEHDPIGNEQSIAWERLTDAIDYSQGSEAYFPWHILVAPVYGGPSLSLVTDDWINWLPIPEPGGSHLILLKTTGYTDARIIDRNGRDLRRLIPHVTKMTYLHWKGDPVPPAPQNGSN
jgi:hypothetical protein